MIFYYSKQAHMPSIQISTAIDYSIDSNTSNPEEPIDNPSNSTVRLISFIILWYRLKVARLQNLQKLQK